MCQKWFVKLCARDFSLDDAPWSGRLVEVDSNQIETLTENNQCYTMWEIANILKISKSIVIGENKRCVLFYRKSLNGLFGQPGILLSHTSLPLLPPGFLWGIGTRCSPCWDTPHFRV